MTATKILTRKTSGAYISVHGEYDVTLSPKREGDPKECMTTMWSALDSKGTEVARTRSLPEMKDAIYALMNGQQATVDEATDLPKWAVTFLAYAEDADNWSGTPWVNIGNIEATKAMKDHLRYAQKRNLLALNKEDGQQYIVFTEKGAAFAREHGISVEVTVAA